MRFGIFQSIQLPDPKAEVRYYREALKQVQFAEELGFDSVWLTEHHFSRHGIVSSTLAVLAYLAGVTSTIRLGSAVTVLPFHNPIQVAEEAATVDLLSDGRLDFGAGRGFQWGEYHKLNIAMDEASRRFEESMDVITKAWTVEEPFDHQGEFWTFNDMTIHPKPVQSPHPPIWVAASSPASVERVVKNRWNLMLGQGEPFDSVARQIQSYRGAVGEAGFDYDPSRVVVARPMYTAATEEQARRDTHDPFMWFKQTGQEVGAPPENQVDLLPEQFDSYRRRFSRDVGFDYDAMFDNVALFGTPDQVIQRVETLRQSGVENLIFFINYGGIDTQKVHDSLELFAKEVMPQFSNQ
jgi:alkanesulfonate monooxygenase SsuD/methylene tetrahydromethanopterin reductase-like flavin-dependent oxidoreductase (luciferase family)